MCRFLALVPVVGLVVACSGGGGGGSSGATTPSWGTTPVATLQAQLDGFHTELVQRIHPYPPGITPIKVPEGRFLDVWERSDGLWGRYHAQTAANDLMPQEYYLRLTAVEHAISDYADTANAIRLNPVGTIANPYYSHITELRQDQAYWAADGQPRVLVAYTDDNTYRYTDLLAPKAGTSGVIVPGIRQAISGARLWPLGDDFYGLGCQVNGVYNQTGQSGDTSGDSFMFHPDMQPPREDTRQYTSAALFQTILGGVKGWGIQNFLPAACTENVFSSERILLAFAYATEPSLSGYAFKGRFALVAFDGTAFTLLGQSDEAANTVWSPEYALPTLHLVRDSSDPEHPYLLAHYQHSNTTLSTWRDETRVYQLDAGRLVLRFTAPTGGKVGAGAVGDMVMHKGRLITQRIGDSGSAELVAGNSNATLAPYKPGMLTLDDQVTLLKSEGGSLYVGVMHKVERPYYHYLGDLLRIDD